MQRKLKNLAFLQSTAATLVILLVTITLPKVAWAAPLQADSRAETNHLRRGEISAVQLEQQHYFLGPIVLVVTPIAMRLDCSKHMGFALVAKAPDWNVTVFRDDDKAIKTVSLRAFENVGMMPQTLQTSRPRTVPSQAPPYTFKIYGFDAKRVTNPYQTHEYLVIKNITEPEVEQIVYSAYRLPTGGGLPLRYIGTIANRDFFTGRDARGEKETSLTTSNVKHVMVNSKFFDAPQNYKPAKLMQEVVVSNKTRSQAPDFQNIFDIANPPAFKKDKAQK